MKTPNILILCIDCLRADKVHHGRALIPNIRQMFHQGTFFANAFATSTTTSPSVASILTGTYPFEHGVQSLLGYKLNHTVETLPEILRRDGYSTHAMVTGPLTKDLALDRGFDTYDFREPQINLHTDWKKQVMDSIQSYRSPWMLFLHIWELHLARVVPEHFNHSRYGCSLYERALSGVDHHLGDIFNLLDPSQTIVVLLGDHGESIAEDPLKRLLVRLSQDPRSRRCAQAAGKILDWTRKYIPFGPCDHYAPGFRNEFEGHGYHIYDFMIRVPLLLWGEGIFPPNLLIPKQVSQVDLLPTLTAISGKPGAGDNPSRGRNLLPLIRCPQNENWQELTYSQASGQILTDSKYWLSGLRTPKWKYVKPYIANEGPEELYDLQHDPIELKNVVSRYPDVAKDFHEKIHYFISGQASTPMGEEETNSLSERLKALGYL